MAPITNFLVACLAGVAAAYPGMGAAGSGRRRGARNVHNVAERAASNSSSVDTGSIEYPAWHPPQNGEVRGPCPALNTLANHDICPRSGKGYTVPILIECLAKGMNIGADFALVIGTAGIASNPNPLHLSFDLDMLDRHDALIEHDASLSRADASTGDDHTFNQTLWDSVLAYYSDMNTTTIAAAAAARHNRLLVEQRRDPQFSFGPTQLLFQTAETALYLSAMGDPVSGRAPLAYVRSLFEEERLPYELGWKPPTAPTTVASLLAMSAELLTATGEILPDGLVLTEYSLRAAFLGLDAVTLDVADAAAYAVSQLTGALDMLTGIL